MRGSCGKNTQNADKIFAAALWCSSPKITVCKKNIKELELWVYSFYDQKKKKSLMSVYNLSASFPSVVTERCCKDCMDAAKHHEERVYKIHK